jgi:hypothetical protein
VVNDLSKCFRILDARIYRAAQKRVGVAAVEKDSQVFAWQVAGEEHSVPDWIKPVNDVDSSDLQIVAATDDDTTESASNSFEHLRTAFGLNELEFQVLFICAVAGSYPYYQRALGWLIGQAASSNVSRELLYRLFVIEESDDKRLFDALGHSGRLVHANLIRQIKQTSPAGVLQDGFEIENCIQRIFEGKDAIDPDLAFAMSSIHVEEAISWPLYTDQVEVSRVSTFVGSAVSDRGAFVFLTGRENRRKVGCAATVVNQLELNLFALDIDGFLSRELLEGGRLISVLERTIRIYRPAFFLENAESVFQDRAPEWNTALVRLLRILESHRCLVFVDIVEPHKLDHVDLRSPALAANFDLADYGVRTEVWERALRQVCGPDVDLSAISAPGDYRFTEEQVLNVVRAARYSVPDGQLNTEGLLEACRLHVGEALRGVGRQISTVYTWSDLILPDDSLAQIKEAVDHVVFSERVHRDWGFGNRADTASGLKVLFSGPPGTGKTLAANVMANELRLELIRIDLSTMISKYVGETEKNLARVFDAAEHTNAIIFFDEADALFGKRSEINNSQDRYANTEVSYLLQRMEEYPGISILATNLQSNLDEAFVRRLQFIVDFPMPGPEDRTRIWQASFPEGAPLASDVNLELLAKSLQISGANIKNIATNAAFLAAAKDSAIGMEEVSRATRREYEKEGKPFAGLDGVLAGQK